MATTWAQNLARLDARQKPKFAVSAIYSQDGYSQAMTLVMQGAGGDNHYAQQLGDSPEETTYLMFPPEDGYCGFSVLVSDMVLNGSPVLPKRGATITIGTDVYILAAPEGCMPWRYEDLPTKVRMRLHTRKR